MNRLHSWDDDDDMCKLGRKRLFVLSSLQVYLEFISYGFTVHFLHSWLPGTACVVQGQGRYTNLDLTPSKKPQGGGWCRVCLANTKVRIRIRHPLLNRGLHHSPTKVHLLSSTVQMGSWGLVEV